MLLLFFLSCIPQLAIAASCSGYNPSDSSGCINEAGCYWNNECLPCKETDETTGQGYYCPRGGCNNATGMCECPTDHPKSDPGTEYLEDCYKTIQCRHQTKGHLEECKEDNDGDRKCLIDGETLGNGTIHYETENGVEVCYTGYLDCDQFGNTPNNCPGGTVTGYAEWTTVPVNGTPQKRWKTTTDPHRCKCEHINQPLNGHNCTGNSVASIMYTSVHLENANATITFSDSPSYHCTQCDSGYYVNHSTDMQANDDECEDNAVCKCSIVPQGYYLTSPCTDSLEPPLSNSTQDICPPIACPVGQTTSSPGTVGTEADPIPCQYSNDTKVCVGNTCIPLTNIKSGTTSITGDINLWKAI
jgi:hypothetical protein